MANTSLTGAGLPTATITVTAAARANSSTNRAMPHRRYSFQRETSKPRASPAARLRLRMAPASSPQRRALSSK